MYLKFINVTQKLQNLGIELIWPFPPENLEKGMEIGVQNFVLIMEFLTGIVTYINNFFIIVM